ncbi:MAG: ABC-F family ATP-binding cassette domain-containing protein [Candidatus Promineifilaceae bacterium]
MPILTARNLSQSFGADDLFADINLKLEPKERAGLVGPNGNGKSSLLHILMRQTEPVTGDIMVQKGLSLGYLQQEAVLTFRGQQNTIYAEMLTVFADLVANERQQRALEARMEAGDFSAELLQQYGDLQEAYQLGGGYDYSAEIKLTLIGLGFPEGSWETPLAHLSGGQKTRVLLARLLLEQPDLLILDEPTNHLDLDAVEWLENTLRKWTGSLIIVSHDRYFLDKVVNTVWELTPQSLNAYRGDYTNFVLQRERHWEREEALFTQEKLRLGKDLDFIRQHMADGQSDQAKGKLKRLTRDVVLLETFPATDIKGKSWIEIGGRVRTFSANEAAQRLRKLRMVTTRPPVMKVKLSAGEQSDRLMMVARDVSVGYGEKVLFSAERLRIERQDRIAILGDNGSGKSSLLKGLLAALQTSAVSKTSDVLAESPLSAEIDWGDNIQVGYFAQAHDQLDPTMRVIDQYMDAAPIGLQQARNGLARYLFQGHDVFKKVGDLSGGERGRLALAILATTGANLLLLDEPTNHLDIPSQEVLQAVLAQYDGTILLVSHDRYLVSRLATHIWDIRGDKLHSYEEGYARFLEQRALDLEAEVSGKPAKSIDAAPSEADIDALLAFQRELAEEFSAENDPTPDDPAPVDWASQLGGLEDALDAAEAKVTDLQSEIEDAKAFGMDDYAAQLAKRLIVAESELGELSAEWDRLMED